jgi:predicted amidohydrolase
MLTMWGHRLSYLFDGNSLVINPHGEIIRELKSFDEDFMIVSLESALSESGTSLPSDHDYEKEKTELTYKALVMGVKDYFGQTWI